MRSVYLSFFFVSVFLIFSTNASAEPAWGSIKKENITMVYLGVASWEFLNSPDHSLGARNISRGKKSCVRCHVSDSGEYDIMTDEIALGKYAMKKSGKPFEPNPLVDKKGYSSADLQVAYDSENIYIRLEWDSKGASWSGKAEDFKAVVDRVALQINKADVSFKKYGCMISCHNGLPMMPDEVSKEEVAKNPYYSKKKRDDLRLYSYYTRKEGGTWADMISKTELDSMAKEGRFTDVWAAELLDGKVTAKDGWILEDRDVDGSQDVSATGGLNEGKYWVVFKRKLKTGDSRDVELVEGEEFSLAIAIHNDKSKQRQHHISFPLSVGIGTSGDLKATKLKN